MATDYNKFKNYNSDSVKQIKQIINDNIYTLPTFTMEYKKTYVKHLSSRV